MDPITLFLIIVGVVAVVGLVLGILRIRIAATVVGALAGLGSIAFAVIVWGVSYGTMIAGTFIGMSGLAVALLAIALAWRAQGRPAEPRADAPWSVTAIVGFVLTFIAGVVGLVVSYIGLSDVRRHGKRGYGFAVAGVVLGWVSVLLSIVLMPALIQQLLYSAGVIRV